MLFESNLLYRKNHDISLDSTVLFHNPLGFRAAKAQHTTACQERMRNREEEKERESGK